MKDPIERFEEWEREALARLLDDVSDVHQASKPLTAHDLLRAISALERREASPRWN